MLQPLCLGERRAIVASDVERANIGNDHPRVIRIPLRFSPQDAERSGSNKGALLTKIVDGGPVQDPDGLTAFVNRFQCTTRQPQSIGISTTVIDLRFQYFDCIVSASGKIERAGEQILCLPVIRLHGNQTTELVHGRIMIAFPMLDNTLDQHNSRHIVDHAFGLLHQPSCQIIFIGAGGENGLHEESARIVPVQGNNLARNQEHIRHPSHIAQSGCIFCQQRHIIRVNLQRPLEPGQSGAEAELKSQQFTAILQCPNISWVQLNRFIDGICGTGLIARVSPKARNINP